MRIQRMRIACWVLKATNTLSEYEILIFYSNNDGTNAPMCYVKRTLAACYKTNMEVCENKMPTRCNRGFYRRSYCLLNMFRAPLCPSSGAQEYYTVVAAFGISCCKNVKSN